MEWFELVLRGLWGMCGYVVFGIPALVCVIVLCAVPVCFLAGLVLRLHASVRDLRGIQRRIQTETQLPIDKAYEQQQPVALVDVFPKAQAARPEGEEKTEAEKKHARMHQ